MAWIRTVRPEEATGSLRRQYAAAVKRAGKVFQIIEIQSLRPGILRASTQLYIEVMHSSESRLSRAQREMIATTVSQTNDCFYWTEAHAEDLRAEVPDTAVGRRLVEALKVDYRDAELEPADRAMLDFVVKLTLRPAEMDPSDLDTLRSHGFDDVAISDIVQITGLFAYYNRLADGLGIDDEPEWSDPR